MSIYNVRMRLLPFLWFSMKLGMINSFLIVCFTMVKKKYLNWRIFTKFVQKYYVMAIKQHLRKNTLHLQSIKEKILPIIFPAIRSTKHFVDQVSADYNGYYIQESGKSDKYGFSWLPA